MNNNSNSLGYVDFFNLNMFLRYCRDNANIMNWNDYLDHLIETTHLIYENMCSDDELKVDESWCVIFTHG